MEHNKFSFTVDILPALEEYFDNLFQDFKSFNTLKFSASFISETF